MFITFPARIIIPVTLFDRNTSLPDKRVLPKAIVKLDFIFADVAFCFIMIPQLFGFRIVY